MAGPRRRATCRSWQRGCIGALLAVGACGAARTVSVPDLHGDIDRTLLILVAAGLVDPETHDWTGGNATLVQTGDMVDRGDHGRRIYELFRKLAGQAPASGGAVVNLLGNHELMNLQEDFRYVSEGDFHEFGGPEARAKEWAPDGKLGAQVRRFLAAAEAGGVLFAHAGLMPEYLEKYGNLAGINTAVHRELGSQHWDGALPGWDLLGSHGPLWTRYFANQHSPQRCEAVTEALRLTGTKRMVVGHTVQYSPADGFRVQPECGGRLLLADTAVSRAYGGEPSYIEHDGTGGAVVFYPRLRQQQVLPRPRSTAAWGEELQLTE